MILNIFLKDIFGHFVPARPDTFSKFLKFTAKKISASLLWIIGPALTKIDGRLPPESSDKIAGIDTKPSDSF